MSNNDTVVFPEPKSVAIEQFEIPEPDSGEVLVETSRSLISTGTELTLLTNDVPEGSVWDSISHFPVRGPGYCNIGEIVEVGAGVDEERIGTRVAVWEPHQRYTVVGKDDYHVVPDGVSDEEATFFGIAQIVMNGVRKGAVSWGESVGVYGLGLLGQLTVQFAHAAGARPVVGLDISIDRLGYLPDQPGIMGVNPSDEDVVGRLDEANHGRLVDTVLEVTGSPNAIPGEFEILREQGRLVVLSSPDGKTEFDFHDLCNRGSYHIVGAHVYSHPDRATPDNQWSKNRHAELFFEYLAEGTVDVESLITHRKSYDEAPDAYEMLLNDRSQAMGVVLEW
ncbi:zinc-binding alcohol dehydrogenase [Haladaptatus sp. CMAA 1911]|uniref:zinc-dependent alcohol dehydrogenase n=1 Tax=unclassified Haladaptatus TaxID=2622732 RepID=UPI0037549168